MEHTRETKIVRLVEQLRDIARLLYQEARLEADHETAAAVEGAMRTIADQSVVLAFAATTYPDPIERQHGA